VLHKVRNHSATSGLPAGSRGRACGDFALAVMVGLNFGSEASAAAAPATFPCGLFVAMKLPLPPPAAALVGLGAGRLIWERAADSAKARAASKLLFRGFGDRCGDVAGLRRHLRIHEKM